MPAPAAPLKGIRVADLSRLLPGPFATQLLADMGAEVLKIEDPKGGDYLRHMPPLAPDGNSVMFHALNRGKKSVALNLKDIGQRNLFLKLLADVDVLVESFRPGVLAKLNLHPAELLKRFPRLVICSISGYGQIGVQSLRAGHDLNYVAQAGVLGMTSSQTNPAAQIADYAGGSWPAVTQILAALLNRNISKKGRHIDVDMSAGARALLTLPLASAWLRGVELLPDENVLAGAVPCYGLYKTADGVLSVGALEPHFWRRFIKVLQDFSTDVAADLAEKGLARGEEGAAVKAEVQRILQLRTSAEWMKDFSKTDACVEPVLKPTDAHAHGPAALEVPCAGEMLRLPAPPLNLGVPQMCCGPQLGANNAEFTDTMEDGHENASAPEEKLK